MMRLVLRWLDSPWAFDLLPGLNRLGRNPTNDFRISDPSVSSFHAEVVLEEELIRVRDLGSTNGTFIDEVRVTEGVLKTENFLRLGNVRFGIQEVTVMAVCPVPGEPAPPAERPHVEIATSCYSHREVRATYRCENCGGCFCDGCVTIVGQGRFEATTVCPVCRGQCYPLRSPLQPSRRSILERLTDTLRLPFSR